MVLLTNLLHANVSDVKRCVVAVQSATDVREATVSLLNDSIETLAQNSGCNSIVVLRTFHRGLKLTQSPALSNLTPKGPFQLGVHGKLKILDFIPTTNPSFVNQQLKQEGEQGLSAVIEIIKLFKSDCKDEQVIAFYIDSISNLLRYHSVRHLTQFLTTLRSIQTGPVFLGVDSSRISAQNLDQLLRPATGKVLIEKFQYDPELNQFTGDANSLFYKTSWKLSEELSSFTYKQGEPLKAKKLEPKVVLPKTNVKEDYIITQAEGKEKKPESSFSIGVDERAQAAKDKLVLPYESQKKADNLVILENEDLLDSDEEDPDEDLDI